LSVYVDSFRCAVILYTVMPACTYIMFVFCL